MADQLAQPDARTREELLEALATAEAARAAAEARVEILRRVSAALSEVERRLRAVVPRRCSHSALL